MEHSSHRLDGGDSAAGKGKLPCKTSPRPLFRLPLSSPSALPAGVTVPRPDQFMSAICSAGVFQLTATLTATLSGDTGKPKELQRTVTQTGASPRFFCQNSTGILRTLAGSSVPSRPNNISSFLPPLSGSLVASVGKVFVWGGLWTGALRLRKAEARERERGTDKGRVGSRLRPERRSFCFRLSAANARPSLPKRRLCGRRSRGDDGCRSAGRVIERCGRPAGQPWPLRPSHSLLSRPALCPLASRPPTIPSAAMSPSTTSPSCESPHSNRLHP